jgi:hypothetical protein
MDLTAQIRVTFLFLREMGGVFRHSKNNQGRDTLQLLSDSISAQLELKVEPVVCGLLKKENEHVS